MALATSNQSTEPQKPIEINPVVDLRSNQEIQLEGDSKWFPRNNGNDPKTLHPILKEADDEVYAKQQMANAPLWSYTQNQQGGRRPVTFEEWISQAKSYQSTEPKKLIEINPVLDVWSNQEIQLEGDSKWFPRRHDNNSKSAILKQAADEAYVKQQMANAPLPSYTQNQQDGRRLGWLNCEEWMAQAKFSQATEPKKPIEINPVVDLRSNQEIQLKGDSKWFPRQNDNNPKTIQPILKVAADEAYAKQKMTNAPLPSYLSNQQTPQRPAGRNTSPSLAPEDGWTMAPTKGLRNMYVETPVDLTRMKLPEASMSENITLGKTSRSNWAFGSSGSGSRTRSQELDKTSVLSNRFHTLPHGASGMDSYDSAGAKPKNSKEQTTRTAIRGSQEIYSSGTSSNTSDTNGSRTVSRASRVGLYSASLSAGDTNRRAGDVSSKSSVALSDQEFKRRTSSLLQDYFCDKNLKEAVYRVERWKLASSNTATFVSYVVSFVLERTPADLELTGAFFHELVLTGKLDKAAFVDGLVKILQGAESIEIDIPKVWERLGDLFGAFTKDSGDYLRLVAKGCKPLVHIGKASVVLANTWSRIATNLSNDRASKVWLESELSWTSYVKSGLFSFAHKQNIEFLNPVRMELFLLLKRGSGNQRIFDWIEENVSAEESSTRTFVRALMTAVCQYSVKAVRSGYTVDEKTMLNHRRLLQRYLDHQPDRELQALYAVQAFVHSFELPSYVLRSFFEYLYDQKIISEDAFLDWEKSEDPSEQAGKEKAHTATKWFYHWLKDTPEESVS